MGPGDTKNAGCYFEHVEHFELLPLKDVFGLKNGYF